MIKLNRDFFENPVVPPYILTKANKEYIGNGFIKCISKHYDRKFNDLDEITFSTNLYHDNELNPIYNDITVMKYILVPDYGFFYISSVDISSEGTDHESKNVTGRSYEGLLGQKYIEEFSVNVGTTESIDGVQFYNLSDKEHSLLHMALLNDCPEWKIGHIDSALMTMERSFEVSRQDIYSFLMNDVATAFECFFIFDTVNLEVNIYKTTNYGVDTNIHVSYNNLLKNTSISCSTDDIKTCLTVTGSNDLNIREVNLGQDRIYNFDYYNSTEFWSQGLYDSYNRWIQLRKDNIERYNTLLDRYQKYYVDIDFLMFEKMPSTPGSKDWSEYGYYPLKEQKDAYEQRQAVSMKAGHGDPSSQFYEKEYLPIYNDLTAINNQMNTIQSELDRMKSEQQAIFNQMTDIINLLDMKRNFTEEQLKELSAFIREEQLSSDNFIVTEEMTDDERFEMLREMLKFGTEELAKASTPTLSFSASILNLFAIEEFDVYSGEFDIGNYIWVTIRDDYSVKAKLLTVSIDFNDVSSFSVTFGNIVRKGKDIFTDLQDAINTANSAATSVSFNKSYWSQAAKDTDNIGQMIEDGLLSAGNYLSSGADSEMLIDKRGIFVNTTSGQYADKDSIYIGGGRILFTDDNWKTVSEAIGRVDIKGESVFGVIAQAVIAGYIAGSNIEGSSITGGTITGTQINNGNGTFSVDKDGNLISTSASIKGEIKASSGLIGCDANGSGGFTITNNKLYNGKSALSSGDNGVYIGTDGISLGKTTNNVVPFQVTSAGVLTAKSGTVGGFTINNSALYNTKTSLADANNGVYVGTDGIALGANSVFKVSNAGYVTATSGSIGGATISSNSIKASNNNWAINSDGSATFKNVTITGVQSGSSFGGISYNNNVTSGTFSGGSTFSSTTNNPFGGTAVTHIQSLAVGQITADNIKATKVLADYATVTSLNATNAEITKIYANEAALGELIADKATIGQLNATNARVGTLEGDHVSVNSFNALSGTVNTINANYITANQITADFIGQKLSDPTVGTISLGTVNTANLYLYMSVGGGQLQYHKVNVNGVTIGSRSYNVLTVA